VLRHIIIQAARRLIGRSEPLLYLYQISSSIWFFRANEEYEGADEDEEDDAAAAPPAEGDQEESSGSESDDSPSPFAQKLLLKRSKEKKSQTRTLMIHSFFFELPTPCTAD